MQLQETLAAQDACDAVWWGCSHGCACRWFIVDDVDMLEDDLQLLKSLFEAEGEGLSKPQIEELCAPLAGLLVTMQLDTGILMSNFKQVGLPLLPADVIASRKGCQRRRLCCHASQILHGPAETLDTFKNQSFFPALQISAVELCTSRLLGGCRVKLLSGNMQATSKGRGQDPIIDPLGAGQQPPDHSGHPGTQGRPVSLQVSEEGAVNAQDCRGQPKEHGLVRHCCHQLLTLQGQDHPSALTLCCGT